MRKFLAFSLVLVTALAVAGSALAYTSPQMATETSQMLSKRLHFLGYYGITVHTRCLKEDTRVFYCVASIYTTRTGNMEMDYNVNISASGLAHWSGTQG